MSGPPAQAPSEGAAPATSGRAAAALLLGEAAGEVLLGRGGGGWQQQGVMLCSPHTTLGDETYPNIVTTDYSMYLINELIN